MADSLNPDRYTFDVSAGSGAALAVLLWDTLLTYDREVDFIWTKPHSSWIKWAFIFARYFPLVSEIIGRSIDMTILWQHPLRLHRGFIRTWYILQVVIAWLTITGAEIVMMSRVYAMYNRTRWIGVSFLLLLATETASVVLGLAFNLPKDSNTFDPRNLIITTSKSFVFFGISAMVCQVVILGLSVFRYMNSEWGNIPIITLMMRDGTVAFGVLFFMSLLMAVYTATGQKFASTTLSYTLTFISVTECRLILNLQKIPLAESPTTWSSGAPLTTFVTNDYAMTAMSGSGSGDHENVPELQAQA